MTVALPRFSKIKDTFVNTLLLGNKSTPELWGILTVYFVQGILGLARLSVSFFLKDDLGLNPAQMSALTGIATLPWVIKPIFGFISDSLPIFGYRRRPYLILSGLLGSIVWIMLGTVVDDPWSATVSLLLISLSVAISDVIVDSLVVERTRQESLKKAGSLQSLTWGTSTLGGLITAYLSGWLLQHLSNKTIFVITAVFPLIVAMVAGLITEKSVNQNYANKTASKKFSIKQHSQELWKAFKQKSILFPVVFIFIWQATPNADSAFFFFITNELGFGPEFLGLVRLVTSIAALVGIVLYQKFLKTVPFRRILGWSIVISSGLGMTMLLLVTHTNRVIGISDRWFSLGDSLILTVMGEITFMPILVLSARLCPRGIEATLFALLMSILNLSGLISHTLGALLTQWLRITQTNFDNLWILVIITNLSTLLPLPFLGWLPATDPQAEKL
ncbi:folate/biopterin family MFS transporter [cyanobacterium endosymbiont of Epithemia turgida]|uniref:folate/biopterin family MFS transporter n=1 Tax=cyanobacterium endosymbiont of Epithemia turgida TaxID=718217 RepID=UPI0004D0CAEF|nr:folate/biopterin family MFS transporter [cyanobacterium endosymbiont of Epithemia turgida]BAP18558.1 putative biopterin transport-related protein BT1 [cyanobacterium endosymbiont of Epithemia turgida isolate EtSB Lake Yunoko]